MKKEAKIISVSAIFSIIFIVCTSFVVAEEDFKVDTVFLKSVIKQGEETSNNLKIINTGDSQKNFRVYTKNLEGFIFLEQENFTLMPNKEKIINVIFKDKYGVDTGVHVGSLIIEYEEQKKEIPVILEVQSKEILFATNLDVAPEYKEVEPNGKISVDIRIFNLNDTKTHTVEIDYIIKNTEGGNVLNIPEKIVVGTENSMTKTIALPENIDLGSYVFAVVTKYGNSVSTNSYLFTVNKKETSFLKIFPEDLTSLAILIFAFLFGILILVGYLIYDKNKMFNELRKQHTRELRFYISKIESEKSRRLSKTKSPLQKKKIIKDFKKIEQGAIKRLKEKQRKQKQLFEKLQRQKKKDEMKKRLGQWKKQGYELSGILEPGKFSKTGARKKIGEWRDKGYKTDVLKK